MWIIKILLVISATLVRAENDPDNGYSYDRPETIPAELAFYLNIPAVQDANSFIANTEGHFNQNQQFSGGHPASSFGENHDGHEHSHFNHYHSPQVVHLSVPENHGLSLNYNQHQFNDVQNQYIPPTPNLPFYQQNSGFRPIYSPNQHQHLPFIQENTGLRFSNPNYQEQHIGYDHQFSNHQHQLAVKGPQQHTQYQVEPRNLNQVPQNAINFHQEQQYPQNQNSPIPSQELQPPTAPNSLSHSTTSTNQPSASAPNHRFMASISNSFNAPLPFPFGVVPIKFDPLPLKTHLLQERLLPISSYEAKVFHKK